MKVAVHHGRFHADDVFSIATLRLTNKVTEVVRTRELSDLESCDLRIDVGRKNNPATGDFDHHQAGGAGKRANGIPFASFGLVWKNFGPEIVSSEEVLAEVDQQLVQLVDADDTGFDLFSSKISDVRPFDISQAISNFNPTWEEDSSPGEMDERFNEAVRFAESILKSVISKAESKLKARDIVREAIKGTTNPRIIVLEKYVPWKETVINEAPEAWYVVHPTWPAVRNQWSVYCVNVSNSTFESRKGLPSEWRAKEGAELAQATGIKDAVFCHAAGFVIISESKDGALKLAEKAALS